MASFYGYPHGEPDDSGPEPKPGDTGGPERVPASGPAVFDCCDACFEGRCGKPDCNHRELDGLECLNLSTASQAFDHEGCFCWVRPVKKGED